MTINHATDIPHLFRYERQVILIKNFMIGNLTESGIDRLLHKAVVGRIGCYSGYRVYVVPISYVYDGKNIYAHTTEGMKAEIMRKNPDVCFEVDDVKDMSKWESVIAWGKFEEISQPEEKKKALHLLMNRQLPIQSSITTHLGNSWPFYSGEPEEIEGILFRIVLKERTGKYEDSQDFAFINC
jgi:nitroimidazol reductase NimA-like FMN-containing flavoprotein (pyridoxamine 5'-phosphate oxidase superfamily)